MQNQHQHGFNGFNGFTVEKGIISFHNTDQHADFQDFDNFKATQNFQTSTHTYSCLQETEESQQNRRIQYLDLFLKAAGRGRKSNKKQPRATQNTFRTILRKESLKAYLKFHWHFLDSKFFQSQKLVCLVAVFRKQCMQGRLLQLQQVISSCFVKELSAEYQKNEVKEQKIQLGLKAFLRLTPDMLNDKSIKSTMQKIGRAIQFKEHPIKATLEEVEKIEKTILSRQ